MNESFDISTPFCKKSFHVWLLLIIVIKESFNFSTILLLDYEAHSSHRTPTLTC